MKKQKINFLIKKLKLGCEKYFDDFYELTKTAVFFMIKKFIKNDDDVKDIMQDTYISFVNVLQKIDAHENPYSYLLTIAKNKSFNYVKKQSAIENIEFIDSLPAESDFGLPDLDAPLLTCCKKTLTPKEFNILELTIIFGYKRVEVAEMLNQPVSTINWQYNQILKKVKKLYYEVYDEA